MRSSSAPLGGIFGDKHLERALGHKHQQSRESANFADVVLRQIGREALEHGVLVGTYDFAPVEARLSQEVIESAWVVTIDEGNVAAARAGSLVGGWAPFGFAVAQSFPRGR